MKDGLRKHWASLLGALFVVAAFITLFQYSIDKGWITNAMKIAFGLVAGIGFAIGGGKLAQKASLLGQILLGIGACILYATFAFAGIYYDMWAPLLVLAGMTAITAGITVYASKNQSRMLMNIALLGGLLAPMLLRPEWDAVFTLFLYALVLNIAFFYLSIAKGWLELRIVAFAGSWFLYLVYFLHYSPETNGIWSIPMRYAVAAYLFYTIGLLYASWKSKLSFDGTDLYLNAFNGVVFGIWALLIWPGDVSYGYIIAAMGLIYTVAGIVVYRLSRRMSIPATVFTLAGVLLILMSLNSLGEGVLFNVLMWTLYVILLTLIGRIWRWFAVTVIAAVIWLFVGGYWYIATWWTPRGEWFGVYIPFLNWGAVAWMALAAIGFYYAREFKIPGLSASGNRVFAQGFALLSHLIVGGLMSRQIQNVFTEYFPDSPSVYMSLTLSIVWGCYALLLVLWGAYYREAFFKWFGSAVLVLVAIKAIFLDLSDRDALFKVIALLVLGAISFAVTWINGKWQAGAPPKGSGPNGQPNGGPEGNGRFAAGPAPDQGGWQQPVNGPIANTPGPIQGFNGHQHGSQQGQGGYPQGPMQGQGGRPPGPMPGPSGGQGGQMPGPDGYPQGPMQGQGGRPPGQMPGQGGPMPVPGGYPQGPMQGPGGRPPGPGGNSQGPMQGPGGRPPGPGGSPQGPGGRQGGPMRGPGGYPQGPGGRQGGPMPVPGGYPQGPMPGQGGRPPGPMPGPDGHQGGQMPGPGGYPQGPMPGQGGRPPGPMPGPGGGQSGQMPGPGGYPQGPMQGQGGRPPGPMPSPGGRQDGPMPGQDGYPQGSGGHPSSPMQGADHRNQQSQYPGGQNIENVPQKSQQPDANGEGYRPLKDPSQD